MKRMKFTSICATALTVTMVLSGGMLQSAAAKSNLIETSMAVLELYVGDEVFKKNAAYTRAFASALQSSKYVALVKPEDVREMLAKGAMRTTWISPEKLRTFKQLLDAATDLLIKDTAAAIKQLEENIRRLDTESVRVVFNRQLHNTTFRTYMLLARAYHDTGNKPKMMAVLGKIMRRIGVGMVKVTEDEYHPGLVAGWNLIKKDLDAQRTAKLRVETQRPGATIILRGRELSQKTPATLSNLLPGVVQLQLRQGNKSAMARTVTLKGETTKALKVDLDFEGSIDTRRGGLSLRFDNDKHFEDRGLDYAVRLGRMLEVEKVMLSGLYRKNGSTRFRAILVDVARRKVLRRRTSQAAKHTVLPSAINGLAKTMLAGIIVPARIPITQNWLGWTAAGLSLTSFIIASVLRSVAAENHAQEDSDGNLIPYDELVDISKSATTQYTSSTAMFVVGSVFAVGSVLAFVLLKQGGTSTGQAPLAPGPGGGLRWFY